MTLLLFARYRGQHMLGVGHCGYDSYGDPDPGPYGGTSSKVDGTTFSTTAGTSGPSGTRPRASTQYPLYQAGAVSLFDVGQLLNRTGAHVWVEFRHVTIEVRGRI